jgi:aminopeptidase
MDDETVRRYADLIVRFGANVQPGQVVSISTKPGQEYLTRAVADAAYRAGAKFVDPTYFDPYIKLARLQHADEDTLDYVPPWHGKRILELGEMRGALIALTGPVTPGLYDGIDPARTGRDRTPSYKESVEIVNARTANWTLSPCPNPVWAQLVFGDREPDEALAELERRVLHVCRLDEPDPVTAWRQRGATLERVAAALNERRFSALRFSGPGTDLTVGLLPSSIWMAAETTTVDGVAHFPNLPSEEVFSVPDPERVDGHVTATKPLVLRDGTVIRGLSVRFERGRAVSIEAAENGEVLRALSRTDDGADRLGEVALVDGESRIGALDTVFYDTLIDENAASHIALGGAYDECAGDPEDRERLNRSVIHEDFMIGSPEVEVHGIGADGTSVPVLIRGEWQI